MSSLFCVKTGAPQYLQRNYTRNGLGFKTHEEILAGLEGTPADTREVREHDDGDEVFHVSRRKTYGPPEVWEDVQGSYDADGNMTQLVSSVTGQVEKALYQYDTENRLQAVRAPGVTNYCFYDGFGQRLREIRNGVTTYLAVDYGDEGRRVLLETDTGGAVQRYYVWDRRGLLAIAETNGTMRYAHADEQGSTLLLTDSTGGVTDAWCYGPWGEVLARTGTNRCGYTWLGGHGVWNAAPNLYLTHHRAYLSDLKRFTSRDPIGIEGGVNLYVYGNNNPLAFLDPLGLCRETPSWGQGEIDQPYSYNTAVIRSASEDAAPYYTDGLLVGSSISPATPFGQEMAFSQAAGYLSAPGAEMVGAAVVGGATKLISKVATPAAKSTVTRYVGPTEAQIAQETGFIPNIDTFGQPKYVHVTPEAPITSASKAETIYQIGIKNPLNPGNTPTHVIIGDASATRFIGGGNVAGSPEFATELITTEKIPVISVNRIGGR